MAGNAHPPGGSDAAAMRRVARLAFADEDVDLDDEDGDNRRSVGAGQARAGEVTVVAAVIENRAKVKHRDYK